MALLSTNQNILQEKSKYKSCDFDRIEIISLKMGEDTLPSQEGTQNGFDKRKDEDFPEDEEMEDDEDDLDDMSPEEFQAINNQLDALNTALDDIEQKNDNIHARLLQLLESNKEIRQQMQNGQTSNEEPMEPSS